MVCCQGQKPLRIMFSLDTKYLAKCYYIQDWK